MSLFTLISKSKSLLSRCLITCIAIPLIVANCNGEIGGGAGLNQNQQRSGNQEGGVDLFWGQIAIDPTGTYFISNRYDQTIYGDIKTGQSRVLKKISNVLKLAFGKDHIIYCNATYHQEQLLVAYHVKNDEVIWSVPHLDYSMIDISNDQSRLIIVDNSQLRILDIKDGKTLFKRNFDKQVVDLDIHPTEDRILLTFDHQRIDNVFQTEILSISLENIKSRTTADRQIHSRSNTEIFAQLNDHKSSLLVDDQLPHADASQVNEIPHSLEEVVHPEMTSIMVPNCSSELTLTPDGKKAFLAPTFCSYDPVSVIDLVENQFVRNLPGFGPVAINPTGDMAIAFINMNNVDVELFDNPEQIPNQSEGNFHLMLINVNDLSFRTLPLGNHLPRYALTPNGQMLLIDHTYADEYNASIRILDVDNFTLEDVKGPGVSLRHFVLTSDSSRALLIDGYLYDFSITKRLIEKVELDFKPTRLNLTPDDQRLILRSDHDELWVYNLITNRIEHQMDLPDSIYSDYYEYLNDQYDW